MSRRAGFLLVLTQCGQPPTSPNVAPEHTAASTTSSVLTAGDLTAAILSKPEIASVCRATLAALNGHDLSIMRVSSNTGDLVQVRYARPSDGKLWINECRVEGDQVIWRTVDAFGAGSGVGRWHNVASVDDFITYKLDERGVGITTRSPDGSISTETYAIAKPSQVSL
jgi:hypothetical protein